MKRLKKENLIFGVIAILGIVLRIYRFPLALQEMNCDEIITALNAESIANTGKELSGISFPVYLQGWGGQSITLLYLMALTIKLLGNSLFAVRFLCL